MIRYKGPFDIWFELTDMGKWKWGGIVPRFWIIETRLVRLRSQTFSKIRSESFIWEKKEVGAKLYHATLSKNCTWLDSIEWNIARALTGTPADNHINKIYSPKLESNKKMLLVFVFVHYVECNLKCDIAHVTHPFREIFLVSFLLFFSS